MIESTHATIRKVMVIYNPRAGILLAGRDGDPAARLSKLFEDRGIAAVLHAFDFDALPVLLKSAVETGQDAVIVCGGDGSILAVIAALREAALPLGLIPAGTMNVLARDIGLPEEAEAAADIIAAGRIEKIDVGYVNGQPFLCNSVIGLMPHLARTREKLREFSGWVKWPQIVAQTFSLMRKYPRLHIRCSVHGQIRRFRTRTMIVSNNLLSDTQGPVPERETLSAGKLGIYVVHETSRWVLFRIVARMMSGSWQDDTSLEIISASSAVLSLNRPRPLTVMNDGEPVQLQAPLHYTIHPQALRVLSLGARSP
ncbi:MAG: diacylglycerol/lipid kinase family protein [Burkholderiales bacterium]